MNCQQPARLLRPMQNERKLARPIVAKFSLRPEDVMSETARNLDQIVARQNEELAEAMTFGVDAYTSEAYLRAERDKLWCKVRSEEHTSELQSLMRNWYAVFCLK